MKTLYVKKHKTNLSNILIDFYRDTLLAEALGFKGGTAAMFFYNLERFSVDLDFDLIGEYEEDSEELNRLVERVNTILSAKYEIKTHSREKNALFWLVSYESGTTNVKIEVSKRKNPHNRYVLKDFFGVKVKVLDLRDMIAHKMVAVTERGERAKRDLFDVHYFLGTSYASEINYKIIYERTGKNPKEFYKMLYTFLSNIPSDSVLDGLGEILSEEQKKWAKEKLLEELKGLVLRQMEFVE